MAEHLSLDEIGQYRRGAALPELLLAFDDHLALCDACRALAAQVENANELRSSLKHGLVESGAEASGHLETEMVAAYVDDSLNEVDREITENHLTVCRSCEREVRELLDFKTIVSTQLDERHEPAPSRPSPSKFRAYLLDFPWPRFLSRDPWRATLAAAAVLTLIVGSAWLIGKFTSSENRQVAQGEGAPTAPVVNSDQNTNAENISPLDVPPIGQTPDEGATDILLALNDGGGRVTLDAEGNLSGVESLAPSQVEAVRAALRTQRAVNPAALTGIGTRAGVLRSATGQEGETFIVRSPVGVVIESPRPTLRWDPLDDATYVVTIYDSSFNPVATSGSIVSPPWTPPRPLARGQIYSWQVTALKPGVEIKSPKPPATEAKFKLLEGAKAEEIQRAKQANPNSHLALGVLYAQAGLLDDAEREFAALLRANPKSEVARKLLNNVRNSKNAK